MFLGIAYNKWHGILAVLAVFIIFVFIDFVFGAVMRTITGPGFSFVSLMILSVLGAHHLQSWNEAFQATDPKLIDKYGSLKHFQDDSLDDWKWFWRGILISWLLPFIYAGLTW